MFVERTSHRETAASGSGLAGVPAASELSDTAETGRMEADRLAILVETSHLLAAMCARNDRIRRIAAYLR